MRTRKRCEVCLQFVVLYLKALVPVVYEATPVETCQRSTTFLSQSSQNPGTERCYTSTAVHIAYLVHSGLQPGANAAVITFSERQMLKFGIGWLTAASPERLSCLGILGKLVVKEKIERHLDYNGKGKNCLALGSWLAEWLHPTLWWLIKGCEEIGQVINGFGTALIVPAKAHTILADSVPLSNVFR